MAFICHLNPLTTCRSLISFFFFLFSFTDYRRRMTNGRMTRSWIAVFVLISMAGTWLQQHGCVAELYTALADMEELLETEAVLIDTLNGYIKAQEERLATLRK